MIVKVSRTPTSPSGNHASGYGGEPRSVLDSALSCYMAGTRPIEVTQQEARRIAVRAQLLDGSATSVLDTVRKLGFLQLDPISTVAPPQHLVLFSRLGLYDTSE